MTLASAGVNHVHDPETVDAEFKCRTCGGILDSVEEIIASAQSVPRARRIQDEIALAGDYSISGFEGDMIVYSKQDENLTIDIFVRKVKDRDFDVVKRVRRRE